jgi:hypothetical protein
LLIDNKLRRKNQLKRAYIKRREALKNGVNKEIKFDIDQELFANLEEMQAALNGMSRAEMMRKLILLGMRNLEISEANGFPFKAIFEDSNIIKEMNMHYELAEMSNNHIKSKFDDYVTKILVDVFGTIDNMPAQGSASFILLRDDILRLSPFDEYFFDTLPSYHFTDMLEDS